MKRQFKALLGVGLMALLLPGAALAQSVESSEESSIESERANQISRQISTNISNRIALEFGGIEDAQQNPLGGSADMKSLTPDGGWLTATYTEISDDNLAGTLDADIYQSTMGIDKRIGDFFVGLTATYAYTETEIDGAFTQGDTHTVNVTPYAAYAINKNIFISAFTSYTYTKNEPDVVFNSDSEADEYTTELTINGIKVIDNWFFKGRAGGRYRHIDTYFDAGNAPGFDNDQDNWTYLVETQAGYSFGNGFRAYAGALYEYIETEDGEDDGVLYMSTGVDYSVSDKLSIGVSYSTDANNEDVDIHTVGLNARLAI